ncbi:MAG: DUF3298 and DUF4163 domain-containing protein [Clostridiales bacterium]|nr:DUF3298 and DUF4163 domain-containing protein [Clostridiales bacterium]
MKRIAALILVAQMLCCSVAHAQGLILTGMTQTCQIREGEVLLATRQASYPLVEGLTDTDVQERLNKGIRDGLEAGGGFQVAIDYALEDYRQDPARFAITQYGQDATAQVVFQGKKLLCVSYQFITYTGGAHPWPSSLSLVMNLQTGEVVPLTALFREDSAARDLVTDEVLRQLGDQEYFLAEDYGEGGSLWSWDKALLTPDGLRIVFDPGEWGPYAAGTLEFLVEYDLLAGEWGDMGGPESW